MATVEAKKYSFSLRAYLKQDGSTQSQRILTVVYELPPGDEETPTRGEMKDRNLLSEVQKRESLRKWKNLRLEVIKIVEDVFEAGVPFPALAFRHNPDARETYKVAYVYIYRTTVASFHAVASGETSS